MKGHEMKYLIFLAALFCALPANSQTRTARIAGQIRDERLRPIFGARIDVSLVPAPGEKVKPFLAAALSRADGTFQIDVPPGTFSVCAALSSHDLLDTCAWEVPLRPVLIAGQTLRLKPIMLKRGYPVTVRIDDAGAVLANSKGPAAAHQVLVGVALPNGGYLPSTVSKTPTGRVHQVFVPRDKAVSLFLFPKGVDVVDGVGTALIKEKAVHIKVKLSGDRSQRNFVYTVQGGKP
jgi:hypothetical protein